MEVEILLTYHLTNNIREDLLNILIQCDNDFNPSLSSRRKNGNKIEEKLNMYLNEKIYLPHLLIYHNKQLIGFSNFIHKYPLELHGTIVYTNYIDTTCLLKEYRDKGIGKKITYYYEHQLPKEMDLDYILRETWSTNHRQIHLFETNGYRKIKTILNDREQGIHSCFYLKKVR